jgi:hypothetical protein
MDGSCLMRVEIELAKLLFHFGKPGLAPNQWRPAECGGPLCQFWPTKARRSVFVLPALQNMPPLCLTLHGLAARSDGQLSG